MNPIPEIPNTNKVKRRRYDEQFKRDAVALLEGGRSASQLAHAVELADLRRELAAVSRQRDILKKALAIVAQENPTALR